MTHPARPVLYSLPARDIEAGMSTDDGEDILEARGTDLIFFECYTPSDDPEEDREHQEASHVRAYAPDDRVGLAVFEDTDVDGSDYDTARPHSRADR